MLSEMAIADLTLNELSRRVGLAKSNVLRYFESREAVLLELLDVMAHDFLTEVVGQLPTTIEREEAADMRCRNVAAALAATFAAHPMLCELLSAQAGVLEHNVTAETAARYKRGAHDSLTTFAVLLRGALPELDERRAAEAASTIIVLVGALWIHSHPAPAVEEAYAADASLMFLPGGYRQALERTITVVLLGLLAS